MGLKTFFGAAFIAFGPPIILFAFTILRRPQDVLVFLSSAFFWLLSLLFSGCVWRVIAVNNTSPGSDAALYQLALGALFAVAFQEFFRYVFYKLLRRTEKDLLTLIGDSSKLTRHRLAYVSGMGYGAMSGAFAFGNVLADSLGPGIVSNIDQFGGEFHVKEEFFLVSAFSALCFIFLNVTWGVIWFAGLDKSMMTHLAVVIVTHYFSSFITLANYHGGMPAAALVPNYILLVCLTVYAYKAAGGKLSNLSLLFT